MSEQLPFSEWLSNDLPDEEKLVIHPDLTRRDLRAMVAGAMTRLADRPEQNIAISFKAPAAFIAAFYAVLILGKTPILFACNPVNLKRLKDEYDFLLSDHEVPLSKSTVLWDGQPLGDGSQTLEKPDENAEYKLFTSGSTGKPKGVRKSLQIMDTEARLTAKLFADKLKGSIVISTVDLCHLYGQTFAMWMPMANRIPIYGRRITYPDELPLIRERLSLVASPTFLRNIDVALDKPNVGFVLSAGGRIQISDRNNVFGWCCHELHEIYGSTETGVVASRCHASGKDEPAWKLPEQHTLQVDGDKAVLLSPLLRFQPFELDDNVEMLPDRYFVLKGRKDRIVKIGERRFSLDDVQNRLIEVCNHPAVVVVLEQTHRNSIGAVVIGVDSLSREEINAWKIKLREKIEVLAIPRYWRTIDKLPMNLQGKVDTTKLLELFDV